MKLTDLEESEKKSVISFLIRSYIRNVCHIYDKNYQWKAWIHKEWANCDDFNKTIRSYSQIVKYILEDYEEFMFSEVQNNIFRKFDDILNKFLAQNHLPESFIDTPEWTNITLMAKEVLEAFDCYTKYINGKITLKCLYQELVVIADKEYQRRIWIRSEGPECDDFDETVCRFAPTAQRVFERCMELGICDAQIAVFLELYKKFAKFWNENDYPELFIDTPEWTEITELAKEVLKAFHYQKEENSTEMPPNSSGHESARSLKN